MLKILNTIKVAIPLCIICIGFLITYKDFIAYKNHPEWSAPAYVIFLKFGVFIFISVIIFYTIKLLCKILIK